MKEFQNEKYIYNEIISSQQTQIQTQTLYINTTTMYIYMYITFNTKSIVTFVLFFYDNIKKRNKKKYRLDMVFHSHV